MDQLNQLLMQRRKKSDELAEMQVNLYANDFKPTHHITEVLLSGSRITSYNVCYTKLLRKGLYA